MKVFKQVSIKADPDKVLEYIANVNNHPAFLSALKSVENISGEPTQVGTTWDWHFVMAGVELTGKGETVEHTPGQRYSFKTTTGAQSTFTYNVEAEGEGTKLTIEVEYEVPETVLGKVADQTVIESLNNKEADSAAENIKAILEG